MSIELALAIGSPIIIFVAGVAVLRWQTMRNETDNAKLSVKLDEAVASIRREHADNTEKAANSIRRDLDTFKADSEREARAQRERLARYIDDATTRREALMRDISGLQIQAASRDGAYKAVMDRFDSLENTVESSLGRVATEVKALEARVARQEGKE